MSFLVPRKSFFDDDIFDDLMPVAGNNSMKCDIYEKDGNSVIELDIPGFKKKDINLDIENGYLTITASKEEKDEETEKDYIRRERVYSKMSRRFYVGDVDNSEIDAEFKDGTLKVVVPKKESKETKKSIEIK